MSSAAVYPLAEADAARQVLEGSGARGTYPNLAAVSLHPPTASAARRSPRFPSPRGNPIPAGPTQVAASLPGGGGLCSCVVAELPANPSDFDPVELARIADAYPPEAAGVPVWTRERYFTPIQRAAWEKRFGTAGR